MIEKLVEGYFRLLKAMVALCLVLMVVLVLGNVVLRYAFNSGLTLSEELSRWLFVYLVFLGAVVALRERAHLGVDSLVNALSPRGRRGCLVASLLLMLWANWLLVKGSWAQTLINLETTAPASGLPVAIVYAAGLFYGVPAGLLLLWDLWRAVSGSLSDADLVMVRESEEQDVPGPAASAHANAN
jgi:TRAP-type C4-dicarboxylate transport system permease small subunit